MAANYTPDEIQAVVEKLVLSTIRRPTDTLGTIRTDISFTDVQQAAAGVFLLYPNSPFYVLYLGVQRLGDAIAAEVLTVASLLDAIEATGRNVLPVQDVSTLFNAQAALQALGSAAAARGNIFGDITSAPAYQQFSNNVQSFLAGPGQNVKEAGNIVQTPQQAVAAIPSLITQLQTAHDALVASVTNISNGMVNYNGLNLPQVVSASVLSNAASLVGADAQALDSLSPTDRLTLIRQTVLNTLGVQAVVTTFGSFTPPSDFFSLDGLGRPYSDAQHLSTPAVGLAGTGAFGVVQGVNDTMTITVDGGTPFTVTLQPSTLAELDGIGTDDRFVIGDGVNPVTPTSPIIPDNNVFKLAVDSTIYTATLTSSGAPTAAAITGTGNTTTSGWYGGGGLLDGTTLVINVDGAYQYEVALVAPAGAVALTTAINAVTNPAGSQQHRVIASIVGNRLVLTTANTGSQASILIGASAANAVLGFTQGQSATGSSNPRTADQVAADINGVLPTSAVVAEAYYLPLRFSGHVDIAAGTGSAVFTVTAGATDFTQLGVSTADTVTVHGGPNDGIGYPITAITTTTITVTGTFFLDPGRSVEIGPKNRAVRIRCIDGASQLPIETSIKVFGDTPASTACAAMLGFVNGGASQCLRTQMVDLATDLTHKSQALTFDTLRIFTSEHVRAVSNPSDPTTITLAPTEVQGTQAFSGTTLTYTVTMVVEADDTVSPGDIIVLRDGPNASAFFSISTINGAATPKTLAVGDVVVATGTVAGSSGSNTTAFVGPSSSPAKYDALTINGGPNNGDYILTVSGAGASPLDLTFLNRILPVFASGPNAVELDVSIGLTYLRFTSPSPTTQSRIQVTSAFVTPIDEFGTSPWVLLPSIPRSLQAGDFLLTYSSDYKNADGVYNIDDVDTDLDVIKIDPEMPSNQSWQFTPQPPPFARLRVGVMNDFNNMKALLDAWLARDTNQDAWFVNFNRLVNPLLVNTNPTATQVGVAKNELLRFYALLLGSEATTLGSDPSLALDSILDTYTVEHVSPVDTLVKSFAEKGSDRANDILLAGQFQSFFGLTVDGASYSGAFQEATRNVARNDLPIRRINRSETQTSPMTGQTQSPDYEYTAASVNESVTGDNTVDPPQPFGEPSNFGKTS